MFSFLTVIFSLTNISLSVAGSVQEYPISENIDKVEDHVLTLLLLYHSCLMLKFLEKNLSFSFVVEKAIVNIV